MSPLFIYKTLRYYIIYTLIFTCKYSCKMNNIYYSILKRILKRFLLKNGDSGDRTLVRICLRIFLMCKIVVFLASVMLNKISLFLISSNIFNCFNFEVYHHSFSYCKFLGVIWCLFLIDILGLLSVLNCLTISMK